MGRAGELRQPLERRDLPGLFCHHRHLFGLGGQPGHHHLAAAGLLCRPRGARLHLLPHLADLALCRGPGRGRRGVVVFVLTQHWRGLICAQPMGL